MTTVSTARRASVGTEAMGMSLPVAVAVIGFALLTWAAAKVSIPLPFTPVPGTLQTIPVLLAGALLGARAGAASQVAYLLMGIAGLPVFALPGAGPAYFVGPTAGYLLGFAPAAYVTGRVIGRGGASTAGRIVLGCGAGAAVVHICGLAWLTAYTGFDFAAAVSAGLQPFLLFDLAKIVMVTGVCVAWGRFRWTKARTSNDGSPH
jgi:biotin transport system substrate-specific component